MKALKSVHDNFNVDFRNHHTKVDDSFKEMASTLATRILCFQCIYNKKIGMLFNCDGSGCDVVSKSENSKKSSKSTSKNSTLENKKIRKRKPVTVMNELEKEFENDDDFKVEPKKKKPKKSNDQLNSQSKANRKKKNPCLITYFCDISKYFIHEMNMD